MPFSDGDISYNKLILKTENGGFSTFTDVFDPGKGLIASALFEGRLAFLRDTSNDVCQFIRRSLVFFRHTVVSSKSVSDVINPKYRQFCRMKLRNIHPKLFCQYIFKVSI